MLRKRIPPNEQKRVPKYKLRKLSIGLVSFMSGSLIFLNGMSTANATEIDTTPVPSPLDGEVLREEPSSTTPNEHDEVMDPKEATLPLSDEPVVAKNEDLQSIDGTHQHTLSELDFGSHATTEAVSEIQMSQVDKQHLLSELQEPQTELNKAVERTNEELSELSTEKNIFSGNNENGETPSSTLTTKRIPATLSEQPISSAMPRPNNEGHLIVEGIGFRNTNNDEMAAFYKFKEQLQDIDVADRIETRQAQNGLTNNEKNTIISLFVAKNSSVLGDPVGRDTFAYVANGNTYHAKFTAGPKGGIIVQVTRQPGGMILVRQNGPDGAVSEPIKNSYSLTTIKRVVPQFNLEGNIEGKTQASVAAYQVAKADAENHKLIVQAEISQSSKDQTTINKKEEDALASIARLEDAIANLTLDLIAQANNKVSEANTKIETLKVQNTISNEEINEIETLIRDADNLKKQAVVEANELTIPLAKKTPIISEATTLEIPSNEKINELKTEKAKQDAKMIVQTTADEKIARLNQDNRFTDEEKANIISQINDKVQEANRAIGQATQPEERETAKNEGIRTIQAVAETPSAKPSALAAIDEAAQAKKTQIDSNPSLTTEEKASAITAVEAAVERAKAAINAAVANGDVTAQQSEGIRTIQAVAETPSAKPSALAAIDEAAQAKKTQIDSNPSLTTEEKASAITAVEAAVERAKAAINAAVANGDVTAQQSEGIRTIQAVAETPSAKPSALAAIDEAAQAKKTQIDSNPSLTTEEKASAITAVEAAVERAKAAINAAVANGDVTAQQSEGIRTIQAVAETPSAKPSALAAIDEAAQAKKTQIDSNPSLTTEEKASAITAVEAAVERAKAAINAAVANGDVTAQQSEGIRTIQAVAETPSAKPSALAAIDEAAQAKKTQIDSNPSLTTEEKASAITAVEAAVERAKAAINAAVANGDVTAQQSEGIRTIQAVAETPSAKPSALAAIDEAAQAKKTQIDSNPSLTTEEKASAITAVEAAVERAKAAINAAVANGDVTAQQSEGIRTIQAVAETPSAKPSALAAIDEAAQAKKTQIDSNPSLTTEEKASAITAVEAAVERAKAAINAAVANGDVTAQQSEGIRTIQAVAETPSAKPSALAAIDEAAQAKKTQIDSNPSLTTEEKASAITAVEAAVERAKAAINAAVANGDVTAQQSEGIRTIQAVAETPSAKPSALAAIDEAAQAKKTQIDSNPSLTTEEKASAITAVEAAVERAKAAINAAVANGDVTAQQSEGIRTIQAVAETPSAKPSALAAIDEAAQAKKTQIDSNPSLTTEEKASAITAVEAAVERAKAAINAAVANGDVTAQQSEGIRTIQAVAETPSAKPSALAAIDEAAQAKKTQIDSNPSLTTEEKASAITAVEAAVERAKAAINAAVANGDVTAQQSEGIRTIQAVAETPSAKPSALAAIDEAAQAKKTQIDSNPSLTTEEKASAITAVEAAVERAKAAINAAVANGDVTAQQSEGIRTIQAVAETPSAKPSALAAIDEAAQAKKTQIDSNPSLTTEEKASAITAVEAAVERAKAAINAAVANGDVTAQQSEGIRTIQAVAETPSAKPSALAAIDEAAQAKKTQIDSNPSLTTEEKASAITAVEAAVERAKAAINAAVANGDVTAQQSEGIRTIQAVAETPSAKPSALAAIDEAAQAKKTQIDSNPSLTTEEKASAITAVEAAVERAKAAINAAVANGDVTAQQSEGIRTIQAVAETPSAKPSAVLVDSKAQTNIRRALPATGDSTDNLGLFGLAFLGMIFPVLGSKRKNEE